MSTYSAYLTFSIGGQFLEKAGLTKLENLYKGIKVRHMYMYSRIEYSYVQAYCRESPNGMQVVVLHQEEGLQVFSTVGIYDWDML